MLQVTENLHDNKIHTFARLHVGCKRATKEGLNQRGSKPENGVCNTTSSGEAPMKNAQFQPQPLPAIEALLHRWLEQRQTLQQQLELLAETLATWPLSRWQEPACPLPHQLHRACQLLIDYISTGHFEVYRQLCQQAPLSASLEQALTQLAISTDLVLAFNDAFGGNTCEPSLTALLPTRLAEVRHALTDRFLLEDLLVVNLAAVT
jgi:regulator of sigma D